MTRFSIPVPSVLRCTRATPDEIAAPSPADDMVPADCDRWVRCITINAPHPRVYRWLCQLTVAPYSFDAIDFPGRRSPRELTPGAERLRIGQHFLIFEVTGFVPDSYIAGCSRPEFDRAYGRIAVSYSVKPLDSHTTRLRANACVQHSENGTGETGIGIRRLVLAAGDKVMAGRQLRTLRARAETAPGHGPHRQQQRPAPRDAGTGRTTRPSSSPDATESVRRSTSAIAQAQRPPTSSS